MADHTWVQENAATYLADGLDPTEVERLEQHVASCPQCAEAVQQARSFDDDMRGLFADVQPAPALEDRVIQSLRVSARPRRKPSPLVRRLALSTSAVVMLAAFGVVGAFVTNTIEQGTFTFPGMSSNDETVPVNIPTPMLTQVSAGTTAAIELNDYGVSLQDTDDLATLTRDEAIAEVSELDLSVLTTTRDGRVPGQATQWRDTEYTGSSNGRGGLVWESRTSTRTALDTSSVARSLGTEAEGQEAGEVMTDSDDYLVADAGTWNRPLSSMDASITPYYSLTVKAPSTHTATGLVTAAPKTVAKTQLYFQPGNLLANVDGINVAVPEDVTLTGTAVALVEQDGPPPTTETADELAEPEFRPAQPSDITQRKVIRSGDMQFEVDSFDSAVAQITTITNEAGGFIATVDSEKLANGKMQGNVVVRVPPERLDTLVLQLRALGELKSQKIGSQDATKQYTDLESRLRAARAMEERLLEIIKTGNGEIEQLLKAEKELGIWRTKIEETEGELRYYNNVIALSTLRLTLSEKEIRAAAELTETERVQMGIEVEDVEQAHQTALQAIGEAHGVITKSELKQHEAEQYSAIVTFEVDRDAAGPLRDRLSQIGRVARLEIDRAQQADGGGTLPQGAPTVRKATQFSLSLYNVANVAPRETVQASLACTDTEAAYKTLLDRVQESGGRVVTSSLTSQHSQKTTGSVSFELPVVEADAVLLDVKSVGEVMQLEVTENPDSKNVTESKRGFKVELWAMGLIAPRETIVLQLATDDVPASYRTLRDAVSNANGRILNAQLNEQDKQNVTAQLDFDIPVKDQPALDSVGEVFSRTVTRSKDVENVIDSKVRLQVTLIDQARIPPREVIALGIEVADVDQTSIALTSLVQEAKGRTVESHLAHERSGRVTSKIVFDVPLATANGLVEQFKSSGMVRAQQSTRNAQVPDGKLATARLEVTLSNAKLIVPNDSDLVTQIRTGLSTSFAAISWSVVVVIVGVCFVLPWAIVLYAVYRVVARIRRNNASAQSTV